MERWMRQDGGGQTSMWQSYYLPFSGTWAFPSLGRLGDGGHVSTTTMPACPDDKFHATYLPSPFPATLPCTCLIPYLMPNHFFYLICVSGGSPLACLYLANMYHAIPKQHGSILPTLVLLHVLQVGWCILCCRHYYTGGREEGEKNSY